MKLYVHYESGAPTWTRRMTISGRTQMKDVLATFVVCYQVKFGAPLAAASLTMFTERHQDAATRRRIPTSRYDQRVVQFSPSYSSESDQINALTDTRTIDEDDDEEIHQRLYQDYDKSSRRWAGHRATQRAERDVVCDFELIIVAPPSASASPSPSPSPSPSALCSSSMQTAAVRPVVMGPPRPPPTTIPTTPPTTMTTPPPTDATLRRVLDIAASHLKARRYRAAREAYDKLVLQLHPTHPEALLGLGGIYLSIGHFELAGNYFRACWDAHHARPRDKADAEMVFAGALKWAECQIERGQYRAALHTLDDLQQFLRRHAKRRGYLSELTAKERMEAQMDCLRAHALYELKTPAEQDTATSLLMHMLPDMQAPDVNLDALQLYARVAQDRGRMNEALSMVMRVLVGKSNDASVKKQLVALLQGKSGMERLLYSVPATTQSAGAAYAFMATVLKDYSVLDCAVRCFEHALSLNPTSAAYVLNHAHALEVCHRYCDAYESLLRFFQSNRTLSVVGMVTAGEIADAVDQEGGWNPSSARIVTTPTEDEVAYDVSKWSMEWRHTGPMTEGMVVVTERNGQHKEGKQVPTSKNTEIPEAELDLLASFFTLVKVLFVNGRLNALPRLFRLLEPVRSGRQLHKTMIRNEQAYYMCIAQLMCVQVPRLVPTLSMSEDSRVESNLARTADSSSVVYVCGDSHTLATAWRELTVSGKRVQLRPALVTGLKHWHLRKESVFYPKANFWNVLDSLPPRSRVIFLFGEIDCREGILQAVEMCKYETVEEGMTHAIAIFMKALADAVAKYQFEALIHPVVPVLNETRHLVVQYNSIFKERASKSKICKWLDFFDDLIEPTLPGSSQKHQLCSKYALDGTHLHPCYLELVERELTKLGTVSVAAPPIDGMD